MSVRIQCVRSLPLYFFWNTKWPQITCYFSKALVDRAYLFDVRTKLYIAMDNINSSEQTMLDVCSGMIEMVDGIANYDENRWGFSQLRQLALKRNYFREDGEEIMNTFDENTESWVTMSNNHLTCLFGVTPTLALGTPIFEVHFMVTKMLTKNVDILFQWHKFVTMSKRIEVHSNIMLCKFDKQFEKCSLRQQ